MVLDSFHPAVARWFRQNFAAPTPAQAAAWPAIKAGRDVLIAAPTGSGKTLAAFLAAIDALVRQGLVDGLKDETQIVYVSPLKALPMTSTATWNYPSRALNRLCAPAGCRR
jgi:ATP-dependent Lhr-like helicase